jgi:hypothetical protein
VNLKIALFDSHLEREVKAFSDPEELVPDESEETTSAARVHSRETEAFTKMLEGLLRGVKDPVTGKEIHIEPKAKKNIEELHRSGYCDLKFANAVFNEAAADATEQAAEKGLDSIVITDNHRRIAQGRLVEKEREHHGTPSKFKRANGHDYCNRSPMEFEVSDDESGEDGTRSIVESVIPDLVLGEKNDGTQAREAINPARSLPAIHLIDPSLLSKKATALLKLLITHTDDVRKIEVNENLSKSQRVKEIQGRERKLATVLGKTALSVQSELKNALELKLKREDVGMEPELFAALSTIAPAVKSEFEGAIALEHAAAGADRVAELRTLRINVPSPNSLVRSETDRALDGFKSHDSRFNRIKAALNQWARKKAKFAAEFWEHAFAGKLTGADGFIVWPEPTLPDSPIVIRQYKEFGRPVDDYLPFPNRMTDEQRLEDAESWQAFDAMTEAEERAHNRQQIRHGGAAAT